LQYKTGKRLEMSTHYC